MKEEAVINRLKEIGNIFEIYNNTSLMVTSFKGFRRNEDGNCQNVTVNILDNLEAPEELRYSCEVILDDGKITTGNPAPDIDTAIELVHWHHLDKQPHLDDKNKTNINH